MSLPVETPTEFKVAVVEKKRELPAKDGKPPKAIVKLGLILGDEKAWAEMFCDIDESAWPKPGSSETLILTQPDNPEWALKARRPGKGGGGLRGRSPAETKAIQRQHSQEMAIRWLSFLERHSTRQVGEDELKRFIDWFEKDIAS